MRRRSIINLLEEADEDATFDQFLELPPELRNYIFMLQFQTFDPFTLGQPLSPPITTVCRQLRQETISLFL